jgi:tetratricopeptide (TPR) repeat protein
LEARTEALLALEAEYQQAVNLFNEGKRDEALLMFRAIEEKKPGMWDVRIRIDQIETDMQIESSLQEGNAAYQAENWELVISAYENAIRLDPSINDPSIKEQLLRAYLNKIILMLQSETASIEDIENAEQYYRKAIALIPQNREFSSERINLEEVSTDLLKKKFSQLSEALLADKSQTSSSINKAVSYLRKSVNFDSKNTAMQSALKNAEYYQVAFQHFSKSEWVPAINNLTPIYSSDQTFAGGNASILLFESYYFLGKQYYSFGFYQDALKNLEQAEIVAWSNTDNLLRLFRLQILLGDTYAELENYENAVSYYRYAMNAINISSRLANRPAVETKFADANAAAENEAYENAYSGYREVLEDLEPMYVTKEVEISDGICLALFASENQSMVEAILEANNLSNDMIISFGRTLFVPTIEP